MMTIRTLLTMVFVVAFVTSAQAQQSVPYPKAAQGDAPYQQRKQNVEQQGLETQSGMIRAQSVAELEEEKAAFRCVTSADCVKILNVCGTPVAVNVLYQQKVLSWWRADGDKASDCPPISARERDIIMSTVPSCVANSCGLSVKP